MKSELTKTLWATADKLRNKMDFAEYEYIILGLIRLKLISDNFEEVFNRLSQEQHSDPEDKDEYGGQNKELLGSVYEYFLGMSADAEGNRGRQFYTPESLV